MAFRVSYRLVQKTGDKLAGWSQNFWNNSTDLTALLPLVEELRVKLNVLTGREAYITSARVSDPDSFRRITNVVFAGAGPSSQATPEADYPSSALLLKLSAPGPYVTRQWIRGVPDSVIKDGGTYTPSGKAGYAAAVNNLMALLSSGSNGWVIRALDRGILKKPVQELTVATGILKVPAHGFGAVGSIVNIRVQGFRVPRGVNNVWQARVIDVDTVQLNFWIPPAVPVVPFALKPTARLQQHTYIPIQAGVIERATSHYTGRPTELLGGRRRKRRSIRGGLPVDV